MEVPAKAQAAVCPTPSTFRTDGSSTALVSSERQQSPPAEVRNSAGGGRLLELAAASRALSPYVTARSRSGLLFQECYEVCRHLGTGATSVVCECRDSQTGEAVAVKAVSLKPSDGSSSSHTEELAVLKEATLLSRASHLSSVPALREVFQDAERCYVVTDLADGEELLSWVASRRGTPEENARQVMLQLVECLADLHDMGIVHRDVKLENILVAKCSAFASQLTLVDFGLAASLPSPSHKTLGDVCGTPQYVAPEVLNRAIYGASCDLWSAGVCLYALLSGAMPFPQTEIYPLLYNIRTGGYNFDSPAWDAVSFNAKDLVMHLLDTNPETRLTAKEALDHRWFAV